MDNQKFKHKWWALIGLSLLAFTAFLDFSIVTTALPFIQKSLNATVLQLQWVNTLFAMLCSMFMVAAGSFGDRFGRRKIFYLGFVVFLIAAIGAGSAQNIQVLIGFRGLQGFAAAIIFTLGFALIPNAFPEKEQQKAIVIYSAITGIGLAVGPFLSGWLIELLNWRWVFWINIPIILIGFMCCSFSLKEAEKSTHLSIDWPGLVLLIAGLGLLIYGVVEGGKTHWLMPSILYTSIGVLLLLILIPVELNKKHPLLDLSIFKSKLLSLAMLIAITASMIIFIYMFFDPLYLGKVKQMSPSMIGLVLFSIPMVQVIISFLLPKLLKILGIANLLFLAILVGFISAVMHYFIHADTSIIFMLVAFIIMGFTWGVGNAGIATAAITGAKPERIGGTIGTLFTFWNVSGSISLAIASVLYSNKKLEMHGNLTHSVTAFMSGYHAAMIFPAIVLLILVILGFFLRK